MMTEEEKAQLDALLIRCREAQAEADRACMELIQASQRFRLARLADHLAADYGSAPLSRDQLLAWLSDQVAHFKASGITSDTVTILIDKAYQKLLQTPPAGSVHLTASVASTGL